MTNQEWIDMLRVIPEEDQNTLMLVLNNGSEVSVDTFYRFEPNFLIMRGRVAGSTDEGRGFFIPYDQMVYLRIERVIKVEDLRNLMGGAVSNHAPDRPPIVVPEQVVPLPNLPVAGDPSATRNALLDRIRAARATQMAGRQASQ